MERLHEILSSTARWLVTDFGLAGLFLVAFCDSSFLSLPEINDILVITMSLNDPDHFWIYGVTAALGSTAGCFALHMVGRRGGRAVLGKLASPRRQERLQEAFRRYDVLAVIVPSLLPPPCPFKVFVLATGVFRMGLPRFLAAVALGRSLRYLGEAWVAIHYGREFLYVLRPYAFEAALLLVALLLLLVLRKRILARSQAAAPASAPVSEPASEPSIRAARASGAPGAPGERA
jgi:membrane protein YqaA with SNARE-associated domain